MSKSTELDQTVKRYILDCIDASGYQDNQPVTVEEKIQFLQATFASEYGHEVARIGRQSAIAQWLMGLPTALTIEWRNHAILELAKTWKSIPAEPTERQQDKILENYWTFMAAKIGQLFDGYRVPKDPAP